MKKMIAVAFAVGLCGLGGCQRKTAEEVYGPYPGTELLPKGEKIGSVNSGALYYFKDHENGNVCYIFTGYGSVSCVPMHK